MSVTPAHEALDDDLLRRYRAAFEARGMTHHLRWIDLEHATALEIGGTDSGSVGALLAEKVAQISERGARLPGIAVAVQLATPCAMPRDA